MTIFDPHDSTQQLDTTPSEIEEIDIPESIGRYDVSEVLGKGGFGLVFKAVDGSLDREVAIKVPRRNIVEIHDYKPWLSEARAVAMLDHPHIVPVYDIGATDDFPFFVVSKFIEGGDLRSVMQREKQSVARSVGWVAQIAEALQHAHTRGLVHRDVKPNNILIDTENHPWLTDFGLALREDDIGRGRGNRLIGTLTYMSPEQARGEGHLVDGRADVFALGIILYELLSGSRPFKGTSSEQLLRNIVRADPRPLRQWDAELPVELDRICMKALAQRRTDRYSSAADMAADLKDFAEETGDSSRQRHNSISGRSDDLSDIPIIPKGLRSFDEEDSEFFLKLVPGPRDRSGIPEILRRLRMRVEARQMEDTFRVGLVYGPSGSGKSSLIRAGLVPILDPSIQVVYVESNARDTESRLLQKLQSLTESDEPADSLIGSITGIRKEASQRKVLIVLDQFEQWLHSHPVMAGCELVNALRQCDGTHVQCLLLIRDDFWMPATEFFHELEIPLVQDVNSSSVDRFETRHARYVLTEFGRAYGCLPEDPSQITGEQNKFLDAVINSLQEDGKIISVHLVVIAQMLKGQPWTVETLNQFGGTSGVDVNFLDVTFSDSVASPHHRALQVPARAVLGALLPEMDTDIKGQMQDADRLRELSGLRPHEFEQLVNVLDGELRLITPTVTVGGEDGSKATCYQLTHDFLVPSLREWLNRNESQTVQGRTRIRLRELSQYWREKQDRRFLPNRNEFLRILAFTSQSSRTPEESKLVRAATRHYGVRWTVAAVVLFAIGISATLISQRLKSNTETNQAQAVVDRLLAADIDKVPGIIQQIDPISEQAFPVLVRIKNDSNRSNAEKRRAMMVLVQDDATLVAPLVEAITTASPSQSLLICERLKFQREQSVQALWQLVESGSLDESKWLRASHALAQLDAKNLRWATHAERLAWVLANQTTPQVVELANGFAALSDFIVPPTRRLYQNDQREDGRINAAIVLSKCLSSSDPVLAELLVGATPSQFEILFPVVTEAPAAIESLLVSELDARPTVEWNAGDFQGDIDASTVGLIESAGGMLTQHFAWCDSLPLSDFNQLAERMNAHGYRPTIVRPYASVQGQDGPARVAAVWSRDAGPWRWTRHTDPDETIDLSELMRADDLYPADMAAIRSDVTDEELEYFVLWAPLEESVVDARLYLGVTEQDHQYKGWGPLNDGGYVPRANMKCLHPDGTSRYSSVRWKMANQPAYADSWNDGRLECAQRTVPGWHHVDVRLNAPGDFDDEETYGAIWWNAGGFESESILSCELKEHRKTAVGLADRGFRPVSLSVTDDSESPSVASVWHRPIPSDKERDRIASRKANALIALLRLGSTKPDWDALKQSPDPRLQSYLINRLSAFGADPQSLADQLLSETNDERKFALVAALSQYRVEQLSADDANAVKKRIAQWGQEHPSAAIHSICGFLCERWDWEETKIAIESATQPEADNNFDDSAVPTWSKVAGHVMIELRDPSQLVLGSPGNEAFRDHSTEISIRSEIPRDFAIAAAEVTLEQYQKYDALVGYASEYTPDKQCPVNSVSWYDAIRYCRWLSEEMDIDEDQMCYPPLDQIIEPADGDERGFELDPDMLRRTGIRLATETEWEYACRAGTVTSRYYGSSPKLLGEYAWNMDNATIDSHLKLQPVKRRLPNGFGAFDMLGNVMEWCLDYREVNDATRNVFVDSDVNPYVGNTRILRGSSIFYIPSSVRSGVREKGRPKSHHPYSGFRIARTLPTE